jgi:hypothetical protein
MYFEGLVIANDDPLKQKRVRVRVPGVHDASIPDAELPWALALCSSTFGYDGTNAPIGVPTVGTSVLVVFPNGDMANPIYLGALSHSKALTADEQGNYPNRVGFVLGDTKFLLDRGGPLRVEHGGSVLTLLPSGEVTLDAGGNVTLTSPGTVTVTAAQILLN